MNTAHTNQAIHMRDKTVLSLIWGFSIGGVGKYNVLLSEVSKYQPIKVRYICILSDRWHCDESSLEALDATIIKINSRLDFSWLPRTAAGIKALKPDLIMTHGFNAHLVSWLTTRVYGIQIPAVMSYHGLYHPTSTLRRFLAPIYNWFTEKYARDNALRIVSVADFSKKHLVSKNISAKKVDVIHNGIPDISISFNERGKLRRAWGFTDQHMVLGITSRLDHVKGLEYLVEAVAKLSPSHPELRLVLVGTGSLDQQLEQRVTSLGIGEIVTFTGFRSDIPTCLAAFDVFMLPSLAEYHSIALLEAMRASKPIVSTDVGGNTESVRDGREAIIVPPASTDALVLAIEKLMASSELRADLAAAARHRFLKNFLDSVMVERTANWLMQSIETPDTVTKP